MATPAQLEATMQRIIELLESEEAGLLSSAAIFKRLGCGEEQAQAAINQLLRQRRLEIQTHNNEYLFKLQSVEDAEKFKGLSQEHMMVYSEVRSRGSKGVFKKELKKVTNLPQALLTRILKLLESRKLIKAVKTITSKNMNLYVLFDVTPSREHTGGPWYSDQDFDEEFVERIAKFMYSQIRDAAGRGKPEDATLLELHKKLQQAKVLNVELQVSDLQDVLKKLMYEDKIEEMAAQGDTPFERRTWKPSAVVRSHNYLAQTPCGVCPVRRDCVPDGVISPTTCVYMEPWLSKSSADMDW